jgi:DNA-binding response OmpR family regulator
MDHEPTVLNTVSQALESRNYLVFTVSEGARAIAAAAKAKATKAPFDIIVLDLVALRCFEWVGSHFFLQPNRSCRFFYRLGFQKK